MTRLKDIAQSVSVSVSTVSLVLNGKSRGRVNEETAQVIRSTAERLGYHPNLAAKSLRGKRTHTIGLLTDSIDGSPFSSELIRGAQQAAWDAGWMLFSVYLRTDRDSEELALQSLLQRDVEGLILATDYHRVRPVPSLPINVPVVCADCRPDDERSVGYAVIPDEFQGARAATAHLIEHGHTRIAYIGTADRRFIARAMREEGWRAALVEAGIDPDPLLVENVEDPTAPEGRRAARALFDRARPTAVFCFGDLIAMGVLQVAAERGIRVPDDLSVVGFDDHPTVATALDPPLTTVRLDHHAMGARAVEAVINAINGNADHRGVELTLCPLISRDTVGPPGRYSTHQLTNIPLDNGPSRPALTNAKSHLHQSHHS